jgi:hypothetical protein
MTTLYYTSQIYDQYSTRQVDSKTEKSVFKDGYDREVCTSHFDGRGWRVDSLVKYTNERVKTRSTCAIGFDTGIGYICMAKGFDEYAYKMTPVNPSNCDNKTIYAAKVGYPEVNIRPPISYNVTKKNYTNFKPSVK